MFDKPYVVMDRLPGTTLNELAYLRPEILEENKVTIAYQLGMHTAFSYVFGSKDGFQTNYLFNPVTKILTHIDKESFLELPKDPAKTLQDSDGYSQEIAACELTNLKYLPSFRSPEYRSKLIIAFRQGFQDKYEDIKYKKEELLKMVSGARTAWMKVKPVEDYMGYEEETRQMMATVGLLIDQNPDDVFDRLLKAKKEADTGRYAKN
ncbi:MAG: hypothetical protein V1875_01630 [Candidatus Altiarchaeota archaeon]